MSDKLIIYLSDDEQDERLRDKSKQIIGQLEASDIEVIYESRDFVPGCSSYDNKRDAVVRCDVVVVILSDLYIETPACMYDVSLAICYERHIIVIDKRKSLKRIPSLLSESPKISGRKSVQKLLQKLMVHIDRYRSNRHHLDTDRRQKRDRAQTLLRDVEREASFDHEMALQCAIRSHEKTIQRLYNEKKMQTHVYISTAENDIMNYERELSHKFKEQMTTRELREKIRFMKSREQSLLEEIKCLSEKIKPVIPEGREETTLCKLQDQMNEILIRIAGFSRIGNEHTDIAHTIPSEVRCFCEKYEKMIGPNIRRFGQLLHLSVDQLDRVEECRHYGYSEMFWQTIRLWKPTFNSDVTFRTFLNALEEVGVDIGGKPMPQSEVRVLHEHIPYILENCYRIIDLVVHLLSSHVLTEITHMYILEGKGDEDRLLRLVNVLTTKNNGIQAICDAFCRTNQEFISEKILNEVPQRAGQQSPVEKSDYSSDSTGSTSSDESKCQVAIVAPISSVRPTQVQRSTVESPTEEVIGRDTTDSIEIAKEITKREILNRRIEREAKNSKRSCCIQ